MASLTIDAEKVDGFFPDATSTQLLNDFRPMQGPVLILCFSPDEQSTQWVTNGSPSDVLALTSQFINALAHQGEEEE